MLVGRLAHDGAEAAVAAPRARRLERQVAGAALILAGTAADIAAAWLALAQSDARGLLAHILAIVIWSLGMGILRPPAASAPPNAPNAPNETVAAPRQGQTMWRLPTWLGGGVTREINEWTLLALLLGLALLPGMAPVGWLLGVSVGAAYRYILRGKASPAGLAVATVQDAPAPPIPISPLSLSEQLVRAGVEPIVDVVLDASVDTRRGAIAILGKQSGPAAVELLRRFLTDEHADVRLDAAVTLARLETHAARAVNEAAEQHAADPAAARRFADACCEYARSGFLDDLSARFYFTEARDALREYLARESEDAGGWIALARVLRSLGETTDALTVLERARSLAPASSEAHLLSIEIAFHERAWTTLRALVREAQESLAVSDPVVIAARWWAEPEDERHEIEIPTSESPGVTELAPVGRPLSDDLHDLDLDDLKDEVRWGT